MIPKKDDREKQEVLKKRVRLEALIRDKKREAALKHQQYLSAQNRATPLEREVKMMAQNVVREKANYEEVKRLDEKKKTETTSLLRQLDEKKRQKKILDNEVVELGRKAEEIKRKNSFPKKEPEPSKDIEIQTIVMREKEVKAAIEKEKLLLKSELAEIQKTKEEVSRKASKAPQKVDASKEKNQLNKLEIETRLKKSIVDKLNNEILELEHAIAKKKLDMQRNLQETVSEQNEIESLKRAIANKEKVRPAPLVSEEEKKLRLEEAQYQKDTTEERQLESEFVRLENEKKRTVSLSHVRSGTRETGDAEYSVLESKLKKEKLQDELLKTEITKLEHELDRVRQEASKLERGIDLTGYKDVQKIARKKSEEEELENLKTESAKALDDARRLDAEVKKLELELQHLPRI